MSSPMPHPLRALGTVLAACFAGSSLLVACGGASDGATSRASSPSRSATAPSSSAVPPPAGSSPTTASAAAASSSTAPPDFTEADPCALTPLDFLGSQGLDVEPADESSVRRTDGADAAATLDAQMLDALLGCDAGFDVTASFYDHLTAARAATAVDAAVSDAAAPTSGTSTAMAASLSEHGVFVDVPDNRAASAKWIVGDIQVDLVVQYSDQDWDHVKVIEVLSGAVERTNAELAAYA